MYLCVFIMREHYGDQSPSHTRTIVQRHAGPLRETATHHHSGLTHKHSQMHWVVERMEIDISIVETCCLVLL